MLQLNFTVMDLTSETSINLIFFYARTNLSPIGREIGSDKKQTELNRNKLN